MTGELDEELNQFARRKLEEEYPYLVLDARYEKIRQDGVITSQAVQVAIGINWEGRRCVLGLSWRTAKAKAVGRSFCRA